MVQELGDQVDILVLAFGVGQVRKSGFECREKATAVYGMGRGFAGWNWEMVAVGEMVGVIFTEN